MKFYSNPYNTSVDGFYFESFEEFEEKLSNLKDDFGTLVEEVEIEAIDGDREEMELFEVAEVNPATIEDFIEFIETSDEKSWPAVYYLLFYRRVSFDEAIRSSCEYVISESTLLDAASAMFDDCYGYSIPEELRIYIDYEKFAADLERGGDMVEFEFGGKTYTCTNANQ